MIVLSSNEVNALLDMLDNAVDFLKKSATITKEDIEFIEEENDSNYPDFYNLIGYKVKRKKVGEHYNDGQLVEYKFTLTNPNGESTTINTLMCLMVGFDYPNEVVIK